MGLRLTTAAVDRILAHGLLPEVSGGSVELYTGNRPSRPDAGLDLQTCLVSVPLVTFVSEVGRLTTTAFAPELIQASGEVRWARLVAADGATLGDVTVGRVGRDSSPDIALDHTDLQKGGTCLLDRLTLVLPAE
jgi:hypothetical protein